MERTALSRFAAAAASMLAAMFMGNAVAQVNAHGVRAAPVMLDPTPRDFHIAAPPEVKLQAKGLMLQQATVIVNVLGPTDQRPFGNPGELCTTPPVGAAAAFTYAANIWASQLQSSVPIHINACFASLGGLILGQAGPGTFYSNFSGAPASNVWYPKALANALHGSEIDLSTPDIEAEFTVDYTWYYGTDGNPGVNLDFVSVVLHELGHGLGFVGGANYNAGTGDIDGGSFPFAYDQFTVDNAGTHLTSYVNPSTALGTTLVSGNVFFSGTNANAANGGQRVALYAPNPWAGGSSYSHLAESFNGTPNALMTYSISPGESEHSPGPVMLGMFKDMGWQLQTASTADVAVVETATPNPAVTGKDVVFKMVATNNGPGTATGVTVYAAYDATASVIWASPGCVKQGSSAIYACTVGTLANGASMTFKLVLRTDTAGSTYNNVGVTSGTTDGNAANDTMNLAVPVSASPAGVAVLRYRLYSPVTQEHLYTTDLNEYNTLGALVGTWVQEGTVGHVLNNPGSFNAVVATPYYRLYNTATSWHHWTTDPNEYYTLTQFPNWNAEGVDGFILPTNTTGATQLYRLLYPDGRGLHHWTIDPVEYSQLISVYGWVGEGGSGFVIQ